MSKVKVVKAKVAGTGKRKKSKNLFGNIRLFRWVKKALVGKSQTESLDLLDQWILKKRALSLFF